MLSLDHERLVNLAYLLTKIRLAPPRSKLAMYLRVRYHVTPPCYFPRHDRHRSIIYRATDGNMSDDNGSDTGKVSTGTLR